MKNIPFVISTDDLAHATVVTVSNYEVEFYAANKDEQRHTQWSVPVQLYEMEALLGRC